MTICKIGNTPHIFKITLGHKRKTSNQRNQEINQAFDTFFDVTLRHYGPAAGPGRHPPPSLTQRLRSGRLSIVRAASHRDKGRTT